MTKQVRFQKNHECCYTASAESSSTALWYSAAEIEDWRQQCRSASFAVNEACGDIDIINDAQLCVQAVVRSQSKGSSVTSDHHERLADLSRELSAASTKTALLYALVLEEEIKGIQSMDYKTLLEIVMDKTEDKYVVTKNSDDDDNESIGTIEELYFPSEKMKMDGVSAQTEAPDSSLDWENSTRKVPAETKEIPHANQSFNKLRKDHKEVSLGTHKSECDSPSSHSSILDLDCNEAPFVPYNSTGNSNVVFGEDNKMTEDNLLAREDCSSVIVRGKRGLKALLRNDSDVGIVCRPKLERTSGCASDRRIKRRVSNDVNEQKKYEQGLELEKEMQNQCNIATALISLSRWEFRAVHL